MACTVVEKNSETLSIEIILVGHLHGKIRAAQAWGRDQAQARQIVIRVNIDRD